MNGWCKKLHGGQNGVFVNGEYESDFKRQTNGRRNFSKQYETFNAYGYFVTDLAQCKS